MRLISKQDLQAFFRSFTKVKQSNSDYEKSFFEICQKSNKKFETLFRYLGPGQWKR